jgi:hypothetical protein
MADNGTLQLDLRSIAVIDVNEYDVYYLAELKMRDFTRARRLDLQNREVLGQESDVLV